MTIDWSDPATRDRLIECVGPDEYNRLHAEQMARSTVATVNGHAIHKVQSRFGSRRCGSGMSMRGGGHRRALRLRTATRFHEQRRTAGPTRRRAAEPFPGRRGPVLVRWSRAARPATTIQIASRRFRDIRTNASLYQIREADDEPVAVWHPHFRQRLGVSSCRFRR